MRTYNNVKMHTQTHMQINIHINNKNIWSNINKKI